MTKIVYYGNRYDEFCDAFGNVENAVITDSSELLSQTPKRGEAEIAVIDGDTDESIMLPRGIIGVVSSENITGLRTLMRSGVRTVTCGMSIRDTITLSASVSGVTVCLQRRLPSVGGTVFEPAEFCSHLTCDSDLIMLSAAVRLLIGREPI